MRVPRRPKRCRSPTTGRWSSTWTGAETPAESTFRSAGGYSISAQGCKFCNAAVTELTDYSYLDEVPEAVAFATAAAARNAARLGRLIETAHYPPYE